MNGIDEIGQETEDDAMDVVQSDAWVGNKRRKLWSETCQRTAMNVRLPLPLPIPYHCPNTHPQQTQISSESRALAASLAPARRTLPALLPQCRTFADHAWAHTSALVEERIATVLERSGSWWEREDDEDGDVNLGTPTHHDWLREKLMNNVDADLDESTRVWETDVRAALAGLKQAPVDEGAGADHPMHWTQVRFPYLLHLSSCH